MSAQNDPAHIDGKRRTEYMGISLLKITSRQNETVKKETTEKKDKKEIKEEKKENEE